MGKAAVSILRPQRQHKWAPSVGAWQRQLNDNAIHAAARMDFLRPESGESPTAIQPKRPAKNAPERG